MDTEEACLKEELLSNDPFRAYTEATAAAEAKGVVANRLQNVVITLDKVRMVLAQSGQPKTPCLRKLSDEEVVDHLWTGERTP